MRDITLEDTIYHDFTTRAFATGIPTLLAGSPVLSVLEENNATPITAGVSVSVSRASVAGLNEATIVATAANGYETGKSYSIYISTGTVGGVSVIGEVVGQFTVASSAAAIDLANGTDGLGAIKTDTAAILVDTGTTLNGKIDTIDTNVDSILVDTADLQGNQGDWLTATGFNTVVPPSVSQFNARTLVAADYFDPAADAVANVTLVDTTTTNTDRNTIWDALLSSHVVSGSAGEALAAAGTAADPWLANLSTYTGTQAGKTVSDIFVDTGTTLPASLAALNDLSLADIFTYVIENSETFEQQLRLIRGEAAGKVGVSGATVTYRNSADSADRIVATTDANGQRTAVTTMLT